jgi:sensor histidine kinase YesM
MNSIRKRPAYIDFLIIGLVFAVLFLMPIFFTRIHGEISLRHVVKIWEDQILLVPVFAINHWLLAPRLMLRKKYVYYFISIIAFIAAMTVLYYLFDNVWTGAKHMQSFSDRPTPIPPYAHLLMYSLMIAGIDTGLLTNRKLHEDEERRHILEKRNAEMQLDLLSRQVSPHFLMNTLNNLYAIVGEDAEKAKGIVMKLSKMMRYMLYESGNGKVPLSREFEFIESYVALMRIRFDDMVVINFSLPPLYDDVEIAPMLFIAFVENAFKYGVSYEHKSVIDISFQIQDNMLVFRNYNNCYALSDTSGTGIGINNTVERLSIIYGDRYFIDIQSQDNTYKVKLSIPLS